ncbi:MAG: glycosyltransferase [Hyphomonadaceae bacterium]
MTRPVVLAYADKMFTPSESFVHRSYTAFSKLEPVFIGHEHRGPAPEGMRSFELGDFHGPLGEMGFKQFGLVSDKLLKRCQAEKPVAIHAHFGKSGAYALPLARKLNVPLVVTYYGGDATKTTNTANNPLRPYNRNRAKLWREAALILPCSSFIRDELAKHGAPKDKMIVHHNSADPYHFTPGEKTKSIHFAGRWTEKKGIDTLIRALARLGPKLEGWTIRLAGDTPKNGNAELKAQLLAQLKAAGVNVELPGWIPADAMPHFWAGAMIAATPSKRASSGDSEGLPLVCVEAMLCGCALLGTRHAGITECVKDGETGYLVDEDDDAALAERLGRMIGDAAKTQAMGQAGRDFAVSDFNLVTQSLKLEEHLIRLAKSAHKLPAGFVSE